MHPAMCQSTLMVCFFMIVQHALEAKTRTTYEELAASGVAEEEHDETALGQGERAQEDQLSYKAAMARFGKRCLSFVGAPSTKMLMLVWTVVGARLMVIHYRFFKQGVPGVCPRSAATYELTGLYRAMPFRSRLARQDCATQQRSGKVRHPASGGMRMTFQKHQHSSSLANLVSVFTAFGQFKSTGSQVFVRS